ncbi:DUF2513 domain-containing protein [Clostridioides sp. ZZV14-6345]|uniref:DUF2513 domain-containing protein n=1 Tax=Clostridioides sp. ZZV14-6345 TaxID=2811496 RepID=UPI001D129480|nr:DUF2513 domain-containing protein [Clostridioides sp. ZZV14-6345]
MVTNQDCIRDILLFIESAITPNKHVTSIYELIANLPYDEDTISYHINLISENRLVNKINYCDDVASEIPDLSARGHNYLDKIRDNTKWNKIKSSTSSFLNMSLPIAIEYILGKF